MQTSTEIVKKDFKPLSAEVSSMFDEMEYSSTEAKDLLIPKILLMQGSSARVKDLATHKAGDIIESINSRVYGSARDADAKSLKFIPIYMYKTWVKHEIFGKKMQYVETYPVTPENTSQRWESEEIIDNVKHTYKLTKNINFYVMLEKDFGNVLAVPHVLAFRSTSARSAAIIENWFSECSVAQKARIKSDMNGNLMLPFAKVFELGGKLEKDDDHSWFVFKTTEIEAMKENDPRIAQVFGWYKTVMKYDHTKKVDNSDDSEEVKAEGGNAIAAKVQF